MKIEVFIQNLIRILQEEYPLQYRKLLSIANNEIIGITVEDQKVSLRIENDNIQFIDLDEKIKATLQYSINRSLMFELLDGKTTLDRAITNCQLGIRGNSKALLKTHKVVAIILRLSQKSPGIIALFNRFRYE
jgi:hypothetical protein